MSVSVWPKFNPLDTVRIKKTHPTRIFRDRIGNLVQKMTINRDDLLLSVSLWWISIPVGHGINSHSFVEEKFLELYTPNNGTDGS